MSLQPLCNFVHIGCAALREHLYEPNRQMHFFSRYTDITTVMVQAGAKLNAAEPQQEDTIYETQLQAATAVSAIVEAPCLLHVRRPFCVLVQSEARYMSSQLQQMSAQLTVA